MKGIYRNVW